jgi:uncharacterized protein with von Willebrand factor type A (vWA) domain
MPALLGNLLQFGRVLRAAGLEVHHGRLLDAIRSLEWIGLDQREDVRATFRALLVHQRDDLDRFDALFDAFFHAPRRSAARTARSPQGEPRLEARPGLDAPPHGAVDAADTEQGALMVTVGAYSASGVSRTKDFSDFSQAELDAARRLLMKLPWQLGVRTTRRWQRPRGTAIDLRPILRRMAVRGELVELPRRRRRHAPRPMVVIGDVSGSMERYSRMILHFVGGLAQSARQVESFVFATRLTRVTRMLAQAGGQQLSRVIKDISDWGGGTRIGESLHTFNTTWARRVMRNGPIVLLVSDGWDRGDPVVLASELARVRRSCHRLIWLNPLLGSASYEPLTRGMQTGLRYVDDFLPVHNLASLEQLSQHLQKLTTWRRRGGPATARAGRARTHTQPR